MHKANCIHFEEELNKPFKNIGKTFQIVMKNIHFQGSYNEGAWSVFRLGFRGDGPFSAGRKTGKYPPPYRLPENAFFGTHGSYPFTLNIMQPNTVNIILG